MDIFYQNVNRIRSKLQNVYLNVLSNNYDIVCITETNLIDSISDSEIFDLRYNVFRRDRCSSANTKKDGGGVALAIKKDYIATRLRSWETDLEDIWISIPNPDGKGKINILLCYIPPYITIDSLSQYYKHCQNLILESDDTDEFLCIGDFNTPNIQWSESPTLSHLIPSSETDKRSVLLLDTMTLCGLNQFNGIPNENNRQLDLVLSTLNNVVVNECPPLSRLDRHHPAIILSLETSLKIMKSRLCKRLNFRKTNFDV